MKKKRNEEDYLPLRYARDCNNAKDGVPLDMQFGEFCKHFPAPDGISEKEAIDFLISNNLLASDYIGKFKAVNDELIKMTPILMMRLGYGLNNVPISPASEIRDILAFPMILHDWSMMKQVYRLDEDFANVLLQTENLEITRHMIEHLPYHSFFVDLEKCQEFAPIKGMYVYVTSTPVEARFAVISITDDMFYSFYSGGKYLSNGTLDTDDLLSRHALPYMNADGTVIDSGGVSRLRASIFTLQLLAYLTSKDPDVAEDAVTKKTYKRRLKVRNTFSEIRIENVGVRVGTKLRILSKAASEEKVHNDGGEHVVTLHGHNRKPTRPHVRRAHWSHYWTGVGRTVYETRWIAPSYVNFTSDISNVEAVIHDVM